MSFKPISISLSPNTEKDDIFLAFKLLFKPWLWKKGKATLQLEEEFKKYFNVKYAYSFNSGRSALYAILKALELNKPVLLQAFTCNAVPNPILWAGLKPIFVDCNPDDFNIDTNDLRKKCIKDSILVVQHTFGMPANMEEVLKIVGEYNLTLIEDCAHSLGAEFDNRLLGTFGKASFFSFSRDKIISSVYGGMAITNDAVIAEKLEKLQTEFGYPSLCWVKQQLVHPVILNWLILPIYNFIDLGKIFLIVSQWLHILSKAVHWKEKRGEKPDYFPKRLPNALAIIALKQFSKLERFNSHREKLAEYYYNNLKGYVLPAKFPNRKNVFLRFAVRNKNAHSIIYNAWKKENLLIGDWYTTPIAPYDTKPEKVGYTIGSCPVAEKLSKETLNLPTHINIGEKEAKRIVDFLNKNCDK